MHVWQRPTLKHIHHLPIHRLPTAPTGTQERWEGVSDGSAYDTPGHIRWLQLPGDPASGKASDGAGAIDGSRGSLMKEAGCATKEAGDAIGAIDGSQGRDSKETVCATADAGDAPGAIDGSRGSLMKETGCTTAEAVAIERTTMVCPAPRGSEAGCTAEAAPLVVEAGLMQQLVDYDSVCFGAARPEFLRAWLGMPGTRALVALRPKDQANTAGDADADALFCPRALTAIYSGDQAGDADAAATPPVGGDRTVAGGATDRGATERGAAAAVGVAPAAAAACPEAGGTADAAPPAAAVSGWAAIRPAQAGWRLGPVFADSPSDARHLLCALRACVPSGQSYAIDVPAANAGGTALVASIGGMARVFEAARMYCGGAPVLPIHRVFGVTGFELG